MLQSGSRPWLTSARRRAVRAASTLGSFHGRLAQSSPRPSSSTRRAGDGSARFLRPASGGCGLNPSAFSGDCTSWKEMTKRFRGGWCSSRGLAGRASCWWSSPPAAAGASASADGAGDDGAASSWNCTVAVRPIRTRGLPSAPASGRGLPLAAAAATASASASAPSSGLYGSKNERGVETSSSSGSAPCWRAPGSRSSSAEARRSIFAVLRVISAASPLSGLWERGGVSRRAQDTDG